MNSSLGVRFPLFPINRSINRSLMSNPCLGFSIHRDRSAARGVFPHSRRIKIMHAGPRAVPMRSSDPQRGGDVSPAFISIYAQASAMHRDRLAVPSPAPPPTEDWRFAVARRRPNRSGRDKSDWLLKRSTKTRLHPLFFRGPPTQLAVELLCASWWWFFGGWRFFVEGEVVEVDFSFFSHIFMSCKCESYWALNGYLDFDVNFYFVIFKNIENAILANQIWKIFQ